MPLQFVHFSRGDGLLNERVNAHDSYLVVELADLRISNLYIRLMLCDFKSAMKENSKVQRLDLGEAYANFSTEKVNPARLQDLLVFNFDELANATNNFQLANKLGQGGFGPVYKVMIKKK